MSVLWKDFVEAFRIGSETGIIGNLDNMIAEDFEQVTSSMNRAATLSWTSTTSFRINGEPETFYENMEVISGTHPVLDDQGKQNLVMGVARLRDGKIYRYDHMRKLSDQIYFNHALHYCFNCNWEFFFFFY